MEHEKNEEVEEKIFIIEQKIKKLDEVQYKILKNQGVMAENMKKLAFVLDKVVEKKQVDKEIGVMYGKS